MDVKCDARTLNLRSDIIFASPRKYRMMFGKGHKMSKIKEMTNGI